MQKRRVKTCRSVYIRSGGLEGFRLQKKKKGNRLVTEKLLLQVGFEANTTESVADDSINDSNIQNCNKGIEMKDKVRGPEAVLSRIKELGVSIEGDEIPVLRKLEEMEQRDREKRKKDKGGKSVRREVKGFEEFIVNNGLTDLPLLGRKYTWCQPNGHRMSRLDRFLFNDDWMMKWLDLKQWGLHRSLSDHCPILVRSETLNWGPKPFKFFNAWLHTPGFSDMVAAKWKEIKIQGWGGFILKEKLKKLKDFLREWSKSSLQEVDRKIEEARESTHYTELLKNMQLKEEMAQQKARKTWLKTGDANTSYFHKCIKGRWRRNEINVVSIEGKELKNMEDIKQGVKQYFANLFTDEGWSRPTLEGLNFKTISEADRGMLTDPFTEEEVRATVWNCDSTKAPGPDGFTFGFLKKEWEVIKTDIMEFLTNFHRNGKLVRDSNASFLVLIPKRENPRGIEEYRPISLIGCTYKILAKLLANRLSRVLNGIIGEDQSAFIEGRQLVDGVLVANEAVDGVRKRKSRCFIFKIDFEKAYDNVSWPFLDYMMERMGFDTVWRGWISECLKSKTVSILVNGSTTKEFAMSRGLRQGDPLSPFLFLMVAEALNGLTSVAVSKGFFRGAKIGDGELEISHLQFADNTLFMGEATKNNIWTVKCIMRAFELVSGLKVNYRKSSLIGINTDDEWIEKMAWLLNCKTDVLPCKYLGVPLGANPRRLVTWKPLIETFRRKLSAWKGRFLSLGGRITLINSVLSSLPVFLMSFYLPPKHVIYELDKIRRNFLWGGVEEGRKIAWVSWDRVCCSKKEGGLGVKNLRWFNMALLGKWWARLVVEGEKGLWSRVLLEKYGGKEGNWLSWLRESRGLGSSWWNDVCKLNRGLDGKDEWLFSNFKLNLGDGKSVSIYDMGHWVDGCWVWRFQWRRRLRAWEEDKLKQLIKAIQHIKPTQDKKDNWSWRLHGEGKYTTTSAYEQLVKKEDNRLMDYRKLWSAQVPSKVINRHLTTAVTTSSPLAKRPDLHAPLASRSHHQSQPHLVISSAEQKQQSCPTDS
ncbi:hypothetical protein SLEP1_g43351 [Rubroshorea leprosula]|uniref:Reverse transcriptase domain-containing protein n=1 Tax=Rubroshorea leprosula TaxID=152421 RepID=A0AAV5LCP5_9ROSI|nr:hypothetical protein SLEP1_g43351 [Rubroshorea leprosula]